MDERVGRNGRTTLELGITSDEALAAQTQPKRVVVIGGGYIAVEFAGIYAGFGSEVKIMYRADLPLRGFDEEAGGTRSR